MPQGVGVDSRWSKNSSSFFHVGRLNTNAQGQLVAQKVGKERGKRETAGTKELMAEVEGLYRGLSQRGHNNTPVTFTLPSPPNHSRNDSQSGTSIVSGSSIATGSGMAKKERPTSRFPSIMSGAPSVKGQGQGQGSGAERKGSADSKTTVKSRISEIVEGVHPGTRIGTGEWIR
jgi:hypothetical protein